MNYLSFILFVYILHGLSQPMEHHAFEATHLLPVLDTTGTLLSVSTGKLVSDLRDTNRPHLQK